MDYNVEDLSPVKKKITFTVPAEEANAALLATIALYKRDADIKGFRKGKVPSSIIESRFKKQIYNEATTDLINTHINQVVSDNKFAPVSRIDVDAENIEKNKEFQYSISFEVKPEIKLPEYKGLAAEQEKITVSKKDISEVIERIQNNLAEYKLLDEARAPQDGDMAVINFEAFHEGKPIEGIRAENFELPLGENQALPAFEDIVKGLKPGEEGEGDVAFPEDFLNMSLAGKTALMKVKLHAVKEKVLPEPDDEFAKKAGGFDSLKTMKEAIEKSYQENRTQIVKSGAQKQLLDSIAEQTDFALPESMVQSQVESMINDLKYRLERKGKSLESTNKSEEDLKKEFQSDAENIIKNQLILLHVAELEKLEVTQQEVDGAIQEMAMRSGQDFKQLREYHEQNNLMYALRDKLLADKAMDVIYDNATITEVEPKDVAPEKKKPATKKAAPKKTTKTSTKKSSKD